MKSFLMGFLVVVGVVVAIAVVSSIWLLWRIDQETVTPLAALNPGGRAGKALLVYQPGLSDFQESVSKAFADGLVAAGWQVSITTASTQAPRPNGDYDLVVVGAPVYMGAPAKPLRRYLESVSDLSDKPVAILLTAANDASTAIATTERLVVAAKGRPVRKFAFTTTKPNDGDKSYTGSNVERALQLAREAGKTLPLPNR